MGSRAVEVNWPHDLHARRFLSDTLIAPIFPEEKLWHAA